MYNDDREDNDRESYFVLSIDGGGFKGLACLLTLAHLMEQISGGSNDSDELEDTPPIRPCQIFDLICGTSAGGLIAILLGRFGLSCREAIEVYRELGATMFGGETDSKEVWRHIIEGGQLSSEIFESKLEDLIENYTGSKVTLFRPLKSAPDTVVHDSTKTFVTVVSRIGSAGMDAYRIRSYQRPLDDIDPTPYGHKWTIFEGARATCAIPLYMAPLKIPSGHSTFTFQGAGYSGFNNPAKAAIDEAEKVFGDGATITLVSLGTGLRSFADETHGNGARSEVKMEHTDKFAQRILATIGELGNIQNAPEVAKRVAKQLLEVASDTEISHLHLHEQFERLGQRHNYHRFNPPQGLGDIDLMDYRQEDAISSVTDAWLKSPAGRTAISAAVQSLSIKDRPKIKQKTRFQPGPDSVGGPVVIQGDSAPPADCPRATERASRELHNQSLPIGDTTGVTREGSGESGKDKDKSRTRRRWSAFMRRLNCLGHRVDSKRAR